MSEYYLLIGKSLEKEPNAELAGIIRKLNSIKGQEMELPAREYFGTEIVCCFKNFSAALSGLILFEELIIKSGKRMQFKWLMKQISSGIPPKKSIQREISGREFTEAREQLAMFKPKPVRFLILTGDRKTDYQFMQSFRLWEYFAEQWKLPRDKKALELFLEGYDYKTAADKLKIARPQAWKKYNSLNMDEYFAVREILLSGILHS
jgi:hypothetical protein